MVSYLGQLGFALLLSTVFEGAAVRPQKQSVDVSFKGTPGTLTTSDEATQRKTVPEAQAFSPKVTKRSGLTERLLGTSHAFIQVATEVFLLLIAVGAFDATWFVALLLGLQYNGVLVFTGACSALIVHSVLAAGFGWSMSSLLSEVFVQFAAGALYTIIGLGFVFQCWKTPADADLSTTFESARADLEETEDSGSFNNGDNPRKDKPESVDASVLGESCRSIVCQNKITTNAYVRAFAMTFAMEWGDRSQISLVTQYATHPLVPVLVGGAFASALSTASAVIAAVLFRSVVGTKSVNMRLILLITAITFFGVAGITLFRAFSMHAKGTLSGR